MSKEEEKKLAENWAFKGDKKSMHKIIRAYSKFVIAYSMKYKNYGLSITDLCTRRTHWINASNSQV